MRNRWLILQVMKTEDLTDLRDEWEFYPTPCRLVFSDKSTVQMVLPIPATHIFYQLCLWVCYYLLVSLSIKLSVRSSYDKCSFEVGTYLGTYLLKFKVAQWIKRIRLAKSHMHLMSGFYPCSFSFGPERSV